MCKQDTESVKVAPESVLISNRGNLEGTHLTRFSPGGGLSPYTDENNLRAPFRSILSARCGKMYPPPKKIFFAVLFQQTLEIS